MLRKLLKHEFRATGRVILPIFGLLLLSAVGANLSIRGMLDSDSTFLSTLGSFFRVVRWTLLKFTKMPCAVSGRRYTVFLASSVTP